MGDDSGTIHPEAKLLSSYEPGKLDRYVLPRYNGRVCIQQVFPFQKRVIRKMEGVIGLK